MTIRLGWIRNIRFHTARTPAAFTVACAFGLMAPSALATPEGGTFVTNPTWGQILQSGPAGQTLTNVFLPGVAIDPSNRHIIHWTSLDLGTQETLNFSGAAGYSVMNRISGLGTATSINGTLNAMTGNVFIVNSAGVVFGQNAIDQCIRSLCSRSQSLVEWRCDAPGLLGWGSIDIRYDWRCAVWRNAQCIQWRCVAGSTCSKHR